MEQSNDPNVNESQVDVKNWLASAMKCLSNGDAKSLKKAISNFTKTTNEFEKFRDVYFPKAPDLNIYHLVQLLARFDFAEPLPREADRWKFVLNLAIEQQWSTTLEQILLKANFINMKKIQPLKNCSQVFDGFVHAMQHMKNGGDEKNCASFIAGFEIESLSYVTILMTDQIFATITYKREKTKNIIVHRFVCCKGRGFLYNREFDLIESREIDMFFNHLFADCDVFESFNSSSDSSKNGSFVQPPSNEAINPSSNITNHHQSNQNETQYQAYNVGALQAKFIDEFIDDFLPNIDFFDNNERDISETPLFI